MERISIPEEMIVEFQNVPLDRQGIEALNLLPHRGHALEYIDAVIYFNGNEKSLTTVKMVNPGWRVFEGHFPGNPILRGTEILESACLTTALLYCLMFPESAKECPPTVTSYGIDPKIRRPVIPGDILYIQAFNPKVQSRAFTADVLVKNQNEKVIAEFKGISGKRLDGKKI